MNFQLSPEHEMIRKMVREFAEKEVAPTAAERDEKEHFDRNIFNKMGEIGLTGIPWEEQYGGAGSDFLAYAIAVEELSRVCASMGVTLSAHISLCSWPIWKYGTEEQKQKYLTRLAEGSALGGFGLTEPNAGSDAARMLTTATLEGDYYTLNGSKIFISNGEGEIFVVFAMTDKSKGVKGISAFIVDSSFPGFSIGGHEKKMGIRAASTCELLFADCKVPKENLLGKEGEGFKIAMTTLDGGRGGIAAQATGIAQGAFEAALNYSQGREQFGQPIFNFQAVSFMLADMATKIEAARLLTYQAAWTEGQGMPYGKASAMAKLFASDTAMEVTTNAVQVFGGYGYSREYPVERMMRDAKITQIYEGTNEIHRLVIARYLK
ncbi:MAG: acyl-CoA dehydrogenase [Dethiobacter sp.]|jgi:acyl-CoA dehydrogenase|nr:acyl-CoA dehydrogenase [Dethiobacter sp.]